MEKVTLENSLNSITCLNEQLSIVLDNCSSNRRSSLIWTATSDFFFVDFVKKSFKKLLQKTYKRCRCNSECRITTDCIDTPVDVPFADPTLTDQPTFVATSVFTKYKGERCMLRQFLTERLWCVPRYMDHEMFGDPTWKPFVSIVRARTGLRSCSNGTCSFVTGDDLDELEWSSDPELSSVSTDLEVPTDFVPTAEFLDPFKGMNDWDFYLIVREIERSLKFVTTRSLKWSFVEDFLICLRFYFLSDNIFDRVLIFYKFMKDVGQNCNYAIYVSMVRRLFQDNVTPGPGFDDCAGFMPTSSFTDFLDSSAQFIRDKQNSAMYISLNKIFACFVAHEIFGDTISQKLLWAGFVKSKDIHEWKHRQDLPGMAAELMSAISTVVRSLEDDPVGNEDIRIGSAHEWINCAQWLIENEYSREPETSNEVPEGRVSNAVWLRNLNHCNETFLRFQSRDPSTRQLMNTLFKSVTEMVVKAKCAAYSSRPLPFNVGMISAPGTGKTTWIARSIIQTAAVGLGIEESDVKLSDIKKRICTVNQSDKFMSSYKPDRHRFVIIDEMGSANPQLGGTNEIMSNITSILGEGEFYLNSAAVEDKGKILFRSDINICLTNHERFGVDDYITNPEAFDRRLTIVAKVRVKSAYVKRDANGAVVDGIDYTKLGEDRTAAVEFKLMEASPTGWRAITQGDEEGWIGYRDYADIIMMLAREHNEKSDALKQTFDYVDEQHNSRCEHGMFTCPICNPDKESYVKEVAFKLNCSRSLPENRIQPFVATSGFRSNPLNEQYTVSQQYYMYLLDVVSYLMWYFLAIIHAIVSYFIPSVHTTALQFEARYQILKKDLKLARTTADRIDQVLRRYKDERAILMRNATAVLGAITAGFLLYKAASHISNKSSEEEKEQYVGTTFPEELKGSPPTAHGRGNKWDRNDGFISHGAACSAPSSVTYNKVKRNTIKIIITLGSGKTSCTHLVGIKDQAAVGVWHVLRHFSDPKTQISVCQSSENDKVVVRNFRMYGHPSLVVKISEDLGMVKLGDINAFRDISRIIPKKVQYAGSLSRFTGKNFFYRDQHVSTKEEVLVEVSPTTIKYSDPDDDGGTYNVRCLLGEFERPFNGHCGSALVSTCTGQTTLNGIACASSFGSNVVAFHMLDSSMIEAGLTFLRSQGVFMACSSVGFDEGMNAQYFKDRVSAPNNHNHTHWLNTEERGNITLEGSFDGAITRKATSKVVDFPNKVLLFDLFPKDYHHDLVRPTFTPTRDEEGVYVSAERNALNELRNQVTGINIEHLNAAVDDLVESWGEIDEFKLDQIIDAYTAINGTKDSNLVSSIPKSTSAGFPFKGKKHEYLVPDPTDQAPDGFSLNPEMQSRVAEIIERAAKGERNGVIYKSCLKDEPRAAQKVADRKIRLFTLGPMDNLIVRKKFMGTFSSIYCQNFLETETVGGINPFSPDWGRVYKKLSRHERIINGDFSKFDKKASILMIMAVFTVIIRLKKKHMADRGEVMSQAYENVLLSIASDLANPLVLIDRDMLFLSGSLCSGDYLTFLVNDIENSIYIRLAFYHCFLNYHSAKTIEEAVKAFILMVVFFSLGDDNTFSVAKKALSYFNFRTIQAYFKSIGLKYTNAAKTDDVYGSLPLSEATIGKRKWVYDPEYMIWKCPIEKASIMKSLTIGVKSSAISVGEQQEQSLASALVELSQYPREEFEVRVKDLKKVFPLYSFPTYDSLLEKQVAGGVTPWIPEKPRDFPDVHWDV